MIKTFKIKKVKDKYFIEDLEIELDSKAYVFFKLNDLEDYTVVIGDSPFEFSRPFLLSSKNVLAAEKLLKRKLNKLYVK